ncbi:28S rRNA (cytosine-C(5))-methyltransferase [Ixodes scapularis]|uniref:28S rRNA (cytosine-C(5))-methyltransferase n=1 Tax=Ixodes scapularis TaxID=6945 RepID=UPI001A9DC8FF|nr:28S rRNA (cytosine-C(5))-methyltransferase [Ixodes scapularis]
MGDNISSTPQRTWKGLVKLPRLYKVATGILTSLSEQKGSLYNHLSAAKHRRTECLAAILTGIVRQRSTLEAVLKESRLLEVNPGFNHELALVLLYELLFSNKKTLPAGNSRINQVLASREAIEKALRKVEKAQGKEAAVDDQAVVHPPRYARVNTVLTNTKDVIEQLESLGFHRKSYKKSRGFQEFVERVACLEPHEFMKDLHRKDWLVFSKDAKLSHSQLVADLHLLLQDKASGMAVVALAPTPGSVVIDACAAPGMKTTYIAALMENTGKILAMDHDQERTLSLRDLVQRAGVSSICKVRTADFLTVDPEQSPYCDAEFILVDPSCTGSGMTNRLEPNPRDAAQNLDRLRKLRAIQAMLLKHATKFPKVRRIAYSTCSVHAEENEEVVGEALRFTRGRFQLEKVLPEFENRGLDRYEFGECCVRMSPETTFTRGFFLAVFVRVQEEVEEAGRRKRTRKRRAD